MTGWMELRIATFAARDLAFQWRRFGAAVLAVASALAPLLILLGLKDGVVESLRADLEGDPATLEIMHAGQDRFSADWFEAMRARPETGFVVPRTARYLNATIEIRNLSERGRNVLRIQLEPTGPGDPLVADAEAVRGTEIVLSASAMQELGLAMGETVQALVERTGEDSRREIHRFDLRIAGVVPLEFQQDFVAYVDSALMQAIENYRGNRPFTLDDRPEMVSYPSFRLYARDIDSVAALREALVADHHAVKTNIREIAWTQRLSHALDSLFMILAIVLAVGGILSVSASLSANVLGQEREIALLRVAGYPARSLAIFPTAQGVLTALIGGVIALLVYRFCAPFLDALLRERLGLAGASVLFGTQRLALFAGWLVLAGAIASIAAARFVMSMDATRRLRDG